MAYDPSIFYKVFSADEFTGKKLSEFNPDGKIYYDIKCSQINYFYEKKCKEQGIEIKDCSIFEKEKFIEDIVLTEEHMNYILSTAFHENSPKMGWWNNTAYREAQEDGMAEEVLLHPGIGTGKRFNNKYGLFPKSFWKRVLDEYGFEKKYDYCFLGAFRIDQTSERIRQWVFEFAQENFGDESYLQFTDSKTKENYTPIGSFDYTLERSGLVPKETSEITGNKNEFDENYFKTMAASKFALCPAGDSPWSMRLYEALMCKAIPIVSVKKESFRSWEEYQLGYKFYYTTDEHIYREDWVEHNYEIFMKYHTFYGGDYYY